MAEKRCEQCGRVGTRGFHTIPAVEFTFEGRTCTAGPITVCAAEKACRGRWPKLSEYELDRLYG